MSERTQAALDVVREVEVPLAPERAFDLFTARMTTFWPRDHSLLEQAFAAVVVEPFAGGRWYEQDAQGRTCEWGRVHAWEPPHRLVLNWQVDASWQHDPDLTTLVEVSFEPVDGGTRVRLRHHGLEAYGDAAAEIAALYASPEGWSGTLAAFVRAVDGG